MEEWEKEVLQTKVLPALYRAKEYLKDDRYDSAYNEIEDAIAVIANRLLPELSLQDLDHSKRHLRHPLPRRNNLLLL